MFTLLWLPEVCELQSESAPVLVTKPIAEYWCSKPEKRMGFQA